ncbi:MAG: transposase [Lachnospiraceae bacterium]|nr:transposase [Lachnospiraceae bacterium]
MPRKSRIISMTGIYHIILRSVNQHIIFEEDPDYQKFLFILSDCKKKYNIDIYAYCLMDNHIHLLLHSSPEELPSFFQSFGARFVLWYNKKYMRTGHLFQERFHSEAVESKEYFLTAFNYIHNNPVKANICRFPSDYRYSSYNAYFGEKNPLVDVSFAYEIAGSKYSLQYYIAHEDYSIEIPGFEGAPPRLKRYISDEKAIEMFRSLTNMSSISTVSDLTVKQRNIYVRALKKKGLTFKQVARVFDISVTTAKRLCKL